MGEINIDIALAFPDQDATRPVLSGVAATQEVVQALSNTLQRAVSGKLLAVASVACQRKSVGRPCPEYYLVRNP